MRWMNLATAGVLWAVLVGTGWADTGINFDPWGRQEYPNILKNASFEAAPHAARLHHAAVWGHRGKVARKDSDARTGEYSMVHTGKGVSMQTIRLQPETDYVLSAWMKADAPGVYDAHLILDHITTKTIVAKSDPVKLTEAWTQVRLPVRSLAGHAPYRYTIDVSAGDGARVLVDDASLEPASGKLDVTPTPQMTPAGGTFKGPTMVTLKTDYPGGTIRFTLDGMEVTPYSKAYKQPIKLSSSGTLRAKVFHDAARAGEAAEARFNIDPVLKPGVPFYAVDWEKPVDEWWQDHVYNPDSPNHVKEIVSPKPRVNVAEVRDANPESQTAGILEAIEQLPESGGTLWFPKDRGPYVITKPNEEVLDHYRAHTQVGVLRRSNIHFLSDGAEIRGEGPVMFTFASMNFRDRPQRDLENTISNFYFKGLTFNGMGEASSAIWLLNVHDALVEDCDFTGFRRRVDVAADHDQVVLARGGVNNIWVRGCSIDSGGHAVNMDGVFNGGVIDCEFGSEIAIGVVRFQTNTDMNPTYRMYSPVMRIGRYVVLANNTFEGLRGNDIHPREAILGAFANTLVIGNRVNNFQRFLSDQANIMPAHNWPHWFPGGGLKIVNNTLQNVREVTMIRWSLTPAIEGTENVVFENNTATGVDQLIGFEKLRGSMHDIVFRGNRFSGPKLPRVTLPAEAAKDIHIRLIDNVIEGDPRPMIVDEEGNPLEAPGITLEKGGQAQAQ